MQSWTSSEEMEKCSFSISFFLDNLHNIHFFHLCTVGCAVVNAADSQQEGCSFDSWALCVYSQYVLSVSVWVFSVFSGFLPLSENMHARQIGESRLSVGENGCSLCVSVGSTITVLLYSWFCIMGSLPQKFLMQWRSHFPLKSCGAMSIQSPKCRLNVHVLTLSAQSYFHQADKVVLFVWLYLLLCAVQFLTLTTNNADLID